MKRKPPLQITIFLLLFLLTIAGKSVEGTAYFLKQDLPASTSAGTTKENPAKQNTPIALMNQQAQTTRQVSGEVVAKDGNTVEIKSDNTITKAVLPSNAVVTKNGVDTKRTAVNKNDYVFATVKEGHTIASLTSFSKYIVDGIRILLILSILATAYFLGIFILRFLRTTPPGGHRLGTRTTA